MDNARCLLVDLSDHIHTYHSQAMIHQSPTLQSVSYFPFSSILVLFQNCSLLWQLFNIQPSTMVMTTFMAILLRVVIIHTLVPLVRPMNRIDPPHSPKAPIKKLVMPVMESNPPAHKRNKCIPRVHCRRFNQLKRQKKPKRHDM